MGDCFDSFTPFLINMQGTIMGYLLWIALQGFPGYEILNQIYPKRRNLPGAGIGLRVLIWLLGARKPRAVFQDEEMRKGKIDLHCSSVPFLPQTGLLLGIVWLSDWNAT